MPIKIGNMIFKSFAGAVNYVMRTKKLSRRQAEKYVGKIDAKQNPNRSKRP